MKVQIQLTVNGKDYRIEVEPYESLNTVIRERLGFTGTKKGCDTGGCGTCSVLVDGAVVYSCMMYAAKAHKKRVTTIEGLATGGRMHPIQEAFVNEGALQCGYCTPGLILATKALLDVNPNPTDFEVREALAGNLCRCTGYMKVFQAVYSASRRLRRGQRKATLSTVS